MSPGPVAAGSLSRLLPDDLRLTSPGAACSAVTFPERSGRSVRWVEAGTVRQPAARAHVAGRRSWLAFPVTAIAAAGVTVLLAAASVPLYFLTNQNWLVDGGENVAVAVLFAVAGFVIVRRQPRNPHQSRSRIGK